jgi:Fe-S-cluster containining protein
MADEANRSPPVTSASPAYSLETSTLAGFSYACRPDCGLCCYAEPIVAPKERADLLQIVSAADFVSRNGHEFLRSRPNGGACVLLDGSCCRGHPSRPTPCREFPLTVHVGTRAQATVVLTCPGVDLSGLIGYHGPQGASLPRGFDEELAAVHVRLDGGFAQRVEEAARRRRRIVQRLSAAGRWQEEGEVRRRLAERVPLPTEEEFPTEAPPPRSEGLDRLPLLFAGRPAPVALAEAEGGWELLELRPTGGVEGSLGVAAPPREPPALSDEAERLLRGYLRYWLERDVLFGTVHLSMFDGGRAPVQEAIALEMRRIGAVALSRAHIVATLLRGEVGPLSAADVREGIRATDQDLLDRPTWGSLL